MQVSNPWVGYISRSYQQIKASLIQGLTSKAPEVTDHSESNILIIIISMFSGVAEMLNYYIDNVARETFILSARRYSSMVKLTRLLDYRVKAANPATVDITLEFSDPVPLQGSGMPYQLPAAIEVEDSNGVKFVSLNTSAVDIPAGSTAITLPFIQQTTIINANLGTSDGSTVNQKYALPDGYVDKSISLVIAGSAYDLVETFAYSFPLSKHFIVEIDEDGVAYVVLGDNVNGLIPTASSQLVASYKLTSGASGNLAAQTITTLITSLTAYLPGGTTAEVSNNNPSTGGAGYEGIEDIRRRAPLSIRTLYRAVTAKDYVDITLLHPGVSKAESNLACGKNIDIFIVPINGGVAQTGLLNAVLDYLQPYRMIGTFPTIRPAGVTNIVMELDVTLKFRTDATIATLDVNNALKNFFALSNQNINAAVYISVLEALLQAITSVEFLNITKLTTSPYARPVVNPLLIGLITQPELAWTPTINPACSTSSTWIISYLYDIVLYPAGKFLISRNGIYEGDVIPAVTYNSPSGDMSMVFNPPSPTTYVNGQSWTFKTYPYNTDIQLNDFTVPAVRLDSNGVMLDVVVNIIQQLNP